MRSAFTRHSVRLAVGLFILGAFGVWGIAQMAEMDRLQKWETTVLRQMRQGPELAEPVGPPWLPTMVRNLTDLGDWRSITLFAGLAGLGMAAKRRWGAVAALAGAAAGSGLISNGLKLLFSRPRPDIFPHLVSVETLSYPSSHAAMAAGFYCCLGAILIRWESSRFLRRLHGGLAFLLITGIGISRVYLGVHYPLDVVAGWWMGLAWAGICLALTGFFKR